MSQHRLISIVMYLFHALPNTIDTYLDLSQSGFFSAASDYIISDIMIKDKRYFYYS